MARLRFGHDSAMALCARVVQASSPSIPVCRAPTSLPFPQGVSSPPIAVLCLGLLSRPHIPAPSPCLQRRTPSQAGWAGLGAVPVCSPHSVLLPHAGCRGLFPGCGDHPSLSAPLRVAGSISLLFLFLSFFLLIYLAQQESILSFWCPRSSASFLQRLCENCSICRCILDAFVERDQLRVCLILCHLGPSVSVLFSI